MSRLTRVLVVTMVTVAALLAQKPDGDEGDGNGGDDDSGNYSLVENTIHAYAPWTLRGAADDWFILDFDEGWVFPHGSNHWNRCVVLTSGQVWDTTRGTNRLVAVGQQMSAVPDESCFTYELTDDNSYLLTWSNFFLNRDTNQPITASIELKRNGDWIATSNETEVAHSRILPFAHNGFGQDADWVRANFTNAEEILSVGYAQWVDAQVGYNLTNGLYKFVATFEEDPPEIVNLTVGALSVAVTNAGDYAFLLEKGVDYELSANADVADIDWWAVDDHAEPEPSFLAFGPLATPPAQWSEDSGFNFFWDGSFGLVNWLPTLRGSPDVAAHLRPEDFPMTFTATLSDCNLDDVSFTWSGSSFLEIDADGATATVNANGLPSWGDFYLQVRADFGWRSLYSSLHTTCGTNNHPTVGLSIAAPQVVFLNDDNRSTRYYRAQVTATCEVSTNVVVSLSQSGNVVFSAFADSQGEAATTITNVTVSIPAGERVATHDFWFRCGKVGEGAFMATTDGGVTNTATFMVIEPLRKLVSNVRNWADGRNVNPSRLVYGTNAWLQVEQNGNFPSSEISWRVVSGPARIVRTNGYLACVEPTADAGEAVIEARFGNDTDIQPRFVLPIVRPRNYAVRVYCVTDRDDKVPDRYNDFLSELSVANEIFAQIGVDFQQGYSPFVISNAYYAVIPARDVVVAPSGRRAWSDGASEKAKSLARQLPQNGSVNIVYVHAVKNGTTAAFSLPFYNTIFIGMDGSDHVLAHELGHILGMVDIYARRGPHAEYMMPGYSERAFSGIFADRIRDWGEETGRGFYEQTDTHGYLIESLLMSGIEVLYACDIPSGEVLGYPEKPANSFDTQFRKVGADSTENKE